MPSRTTPINLQHVRGCPRGVQIYRIPASPYWQFRFFVQRKYVRQSTHERDIREALTKAKQIYLDVVLKEKLNTSIHPTTFPAVTKQFLNSQEAEVASGDLEGRTQKEDIKKLTSDILPFFQDRDVAIITTATLKEYHATLRRRSLSKSTRNKHFCVIRKVLALAVEHEIIKTVPAFPSIGVECRLQQSIHRPALLVGRMEIISGTKLKTEPFSAAKTT
jgi:Phage integrase SAM-like domain